MRRVINLSEERDKIIQRKIDYQSIFAILKNTTSELSVYEDIPEVKETIYILQSFSEKIEEKF